MASTARAEHKISSNLSAATRSKFPLIGAVSAMLIASSGLPTATAQNVSGDVVSDVTNIAKPDAEPNSRLIVTFANPNQQAADRALLPELLDLPLAGILFRQPLSAQVVNGEEDAIEIWTLDPDTDATALVEELSERDDILYAEPDYARGPHATPNDSLFDNQWYARNTGAIYRGRRGVSGADLQLTDAWDIETGSPEVVVAVIDDGIDLSHPDLRDRLWVNTGEIPNNGRDDDGNGFTDDVNGWDFDRNDSNPNPDTTGRNHGTAVAGVIAARGNNINGIAGAAWNVKIMVLKTDYTVSATIRAMDYARANGAHIINTSFGGSQYSNSEYAAIRRLRDAGILMVASAGNEHWNNDFGASFPSSYDSINILAVAASSPSDNFTRWSQYGQVSVDVAAPGDAIFTTEANGTDDASHYGWRNGTSFSSPLLAGVAALVKSQYPNADFSEMKGRMLATAEPIADGTCRVGSGGRANALASLEVAAQPVPSLTAIRWVDGNNDRADSNETGALQFEFETLWQSGGETAVILRSNDPLLQITEPQKLLSGLPKNQRTSITFAASTGQLNGHHEFPLTLQFVAPGYTAERNYCLQAGVLLDQQTLTQTLQQNAQDDVHRYSIDVPQGAPVLSLRLEASNNLDLYLRHSTWPERDEVLRTSSSYGKGTPTYFAAGVTGNEQITLTSPAAGNWYVTVVNASQRSNSEYSVFAAFSNPSNNQPDTPASEGDKPNEESSLNSAGGDTASSGGGGGGSSGGIWLALLLLFGLLRLPDTALTSPTKRKR